MKRGNHGKERGINCDESPFIQLYSHAYVKRKRAKREAGTGRGTRVEWEERRMSWTYFELEWYTRHHRSTLRSASQ